MTQLKYYNGTTWVTAVVGSQGFQGDQGNQGTQGTQGATGSQGSAGATGPQGSTGAQGNQGNQGFQGTQGNQGFQGYQGATGSTGSTGSQGATGAQGSQGYQGSQGATGSQGTQGSTGATGTQGNQGYQGPQGFQGFQGVQGTQGNQGNQGYQGYQGNQGNTGAQSQIMIGYPGTSVTATGSTSGTAAALSPGYNVVSGATATSNGGSGTGVILPNPSFFGETVLIDNTNGSNWLLIYPNGSSQTIDGASGGAAVWISPSAYWQGVAESTGTSANWASFVGATVAGTGLTFTYGNGQGTIALASTTGSGASVLATNPTIAGATFSGTLNMGNNVIQNAQMLTSTEQFYTSSTAMASGSSYAIYPSTSSIWLFNTNPTSSGAITLNFAYSSTVSMNSYLSTGESLTAVVMVNQGSSYQVYPSTIQIDGTTQTVWWAGGNAPSSADVSNYDVYSFTIMKTGSATYIVLASAIEY